MKRILYPILWLGCLLFIAACSDDEPASDVLRAGSITIYVDSNPWRIPARADRYSIYMESDGSGWTATCESEWVTLSATAGSGSDYLHFEVTENTNPFARESLITIADAADPTQRARLRIRQAGYNDEENATLTGDMQQKHRMGYGYDITKAYCDDQSFSPKPIIDYNEVVKQEEATGTIIITEDRRHYQELEIFSGNTVTELCGELTKSMETKKTFAGCGKVTNNTTDIYREKDIMQVYGLVRLKQLISSRTVDLAALRSQATSDDSPLFSPEFRGILAGIKAGNEESLNKLINNYGTHLVVSADLGGCLELHTSVTRETSIEKEHSVTTVSRKIFGKNICSSSSTYDKYQSEIGIDYEADLSVIGGSDDTKKAMLQAISNKKVVREISAKEINQWQASFNIDPSAAGKDYNVGMVGCRLVPIYEVVNDVTTRQRIAQKIASYTKSCAKVVQPIPPYTFAVSDAHNKWGNDGREVLKLIGNNNMQAFIAKEYVQDISLTEPVVVAYPIVNGKAFCYGGLFIGDKTHRPGYVRWLGDNGIYEPNDSISIDDERFASLFDSDTHALKTIYLYNGGIHMTPPDKNDFPDMPLTPLNAEQALLKYRYTGENDEMRSMAAIKVGPLFWSMKSIPLEYNNKIREENQFTQISSLLGSLESHFKINQLPTPKQAQSLMNVCNGRMDVLFDRNQNYKNLLGLQWATGFLYKDTPFDTEAFVIVSQDDGGKLIISRLTRSGQASSIYPRTYFDSVCDHYYDALYAPSYLATQVLF